MNCAHTKNGSRNQVSPGARSCTIVVPGSAPQTAAQDFQQLADWCAAHEVAHDPYGSGALAEDFEAKVAARLGKPAAVFMPSGVMAQLAALRVWCEATRTPRFDLVYHVVSPHRRARLRLKVGLNADESIETLTGLYPGAGWPERELYDLFGVVFDGHQDLRRLMMPDDWEGYPLRKDYPIQLRKDAQTYMPLQVTEEEFRANLERDRYQRGTRKA